MALYVFCGQPRRPHPRPNATQRNAELYGRLSDRQRNGGRDGWMGGWVGGWDGPYRNRQEEFEFGRKLLLRIQTIGEINATDATVGMDLHAQRLNVIRTFRIDRSMDQ